MQINEIRVFRVFRCSRTRQGINEAFVFASLGVLVGLNDKSVFISFSPPSGVFTLHYSAGAKIGGGSEMQ